jgi:UDP-glucose 4-epimerase
MPKVLVTGGAGFIGSHLVDGLIERGFEVRLLDNLSTGKFENIAAHEDAIDFMEGDVRDRAKVSEAVRGVDYILHAAAIRAVLRSVDNPIETHEVNVTGTLNLLLAARDAGVKRFVFSSSSAVYGNTDKLPSQESDAPSSESPYAVSKKSGEDYCGLFTKLYGLETVCLRYFNVFGPRQNPESKYSMVIPMLIDNLVNAESPEIHWDGRQSRDFVYVGDVVRANVLALEKKDVAGQMFNVGSGEAHSILDILEKLKSILNTSDTAPAFKPKRECDVRKTLADLSKAKALLGYHPAMRFDDGLAHSVEWFTEKLAA